MAPRITDLFTEDELECLAKTAAEVVDRFDHDDLIGFLSTRQIVVAEKAYRELLDVNESGDE
ncbi:hypothetical protein AB0K21_21650 [Streptosporangium sp. NPDC049248]|uniref:hypothetical protein n=1 Tax=Streptosporangium sp. NPDC049248 TaxID=3155651 RepID=UPI00341A3E38